MCEKLFSQLEERLECLKVNNINEDAETHYFKEFFMSYFEFINLVLVKYSYVGFKGTALLTIFTPAVKFAYEKISSIEIVTGNSQENPSLLTGDNYSDMNYPVCFLNESSIHPPLVENADVCPWNQY